MAFDTDKIIALAPDQASLKAAGKLLKPAKWPVRARGDGLAWGECQGSGANPYRAVFDQGDLGYKCTCPSRKFPCKHVLALMWLFVEDDAAFAQAQPPLWVKDWLGRRRKSADTPEKPSAAGKSLEAARSAEPNKPADAKTEARRKAVADKRARATRASLEAAALELEQWIEDQLRGGLNGFLNEAGERCRTIAARLVDGKAQALASRLDELPAQLMARSGVARVDFLIQELGRILLILRAWRAAPTDAELHRLVATSETRESLLTKEDNLRVDAVWEVLSERIATRRDGLVSQSTWLLSHGAGPRFALLLDFFPATLGRRSTGFTPGERFVAEVIYYPARFPLRAVLANRSDQPTDAVSCQDWPEPMAEPLAAYAEMLAQVPWMDPAPLLLPAGRLAAAGSGLWWRPEQDGPPLPIAEQPPAQLAGMTLLGAAGLWDGARLSLLAAQSDWGRLYFDA